MFRKAITIIVLCFISKILTACFILNPENCPEDKPTYQFNYSTLKIENLDNSGKEPVVATSSALKEAFGIRLTFSLIKIAEHKNKFYSICNSAYADCAFNPKLHPTDTITSIKIITNNKFDNEHDQAADVTEYFRYRYVHGNYATIPQMLSDTFQDGFIEDYDLDTNRRTIDLFLLTPPTNVAKYSFDIELNFSSGTMMSGTTALINLD